MQIYNDWLSDYCSYDTERLWGVALIPNIGVDAAVSEFERALALPGMRGAMIAQYPPSWWFENWLASQIRKPATAVARSVVVARVNPYMRITSFG